MEDIDPHLQDVLFSLRAGMQTVIQVTEPYGLQDMRNNVMLQLAVSKAVEWVGELSGRVLKRWPDFAARHPDIEFSAAYRARNRLAHGYDSVDLETLWVTATTWIPSMELALAKALASHARP